MRRRRKKRRPAYPQDRLESDLPRPEYQWLNQVNRGSMPSALVGVSDNPEATVAWIRANCKFARSQDAEGA
jgi:hypothetical protein